MKSDQKIPYILAGARTPFAKSQTVYSDVTRKELMLASLNGLIQKTSLQNKTLGDVALGALMNSSSDWNLARECVLESPLHPDTPAYNVQRACGTSLDTVWQIALKVHTGQIDLGIAGGVDTNSDVPIEVSDDLKKFLLKLNSAKNFSQKLAAFKYLSFSSFKPKLPAVVEPKTKLSMGEHCEKMVKEWMIERAAQDELAYLSHLHGTQAYARGFYDDLVIEFKQSKKDFTLRSDTTVEKLAKLKPAFDLTGAGTLTAGNSSPLTDGSACVLIGHQEAAQRLGLFPLAKIIDVQVAAVDFVHGAGLLMAPTKAVSQLLTRNKISFSDIDFFELHEAFAGQVLCNMKAWESEKYCKEVLGLKNAIGSVNRQRLNVVGSSLALGHPFAATGARITATLSKLLSENKSKRGLISICTAGGMGVAALLESA